MKSMTGFGRGEFSIDSGERVTLEVKTVNHRFCEVNVRLPTRYLIFEAELIEFTKKHFQRGRIDVFIRESKKKIQPRVSINKDQLDFYIQTLQGLARRFSLDVAFHPEWLLMLPQVVVQEEDQASKEILISFKKHLSKVFEAVDKMRQKEGKGIEKDLMARLKIIFQKVCRIEKQVPPFLQEYQARLREKVQKIASSGVDEWRLAQEIAYLADKTDISEEIQRLKAHAVHFREVSLEQDTVGRKFDFILQEMNREINTIGSKFQHAEVSRHVVACKHEIEKMREQVQNIE